MRDSQEVGRFGRPNESGSALVITLLVATALLVAGGALIQITSMSSANAIDSTSETQAYYAAEAGIQAALNVLRGNTTPSCHHHAVRHESDQLP